MKAGNSFTIEPMISEGTWRDEHWYLNIFKNFLFFKLIFQFVKISGQITGQQ